jgi:hypothetical protein
MKCEKIYRTKETYKSIKKILEIKGLFKKKNIKKKIALFSLAC